MTQKPRPRKRRKRSKHNYMENNYANEVIRQGLDAEPGLYITDVYHDDWCAFFDGGVCNCKPDVRTREWGRRDDA